MTSPPTRKHPNLGTAAGSLRHPRLGIVPEYQCPTAPAKREMYAEHSEDGNILSRPPWWQNRPETGSASERASLEAGNGGIFLRLYILGHETMSDFFLSYLLFYIMAFWDEDQVYKIVRIMGQAY